MLGLVHLHLFYLVFPNLMDRVVKFILYFIIENVPVRFLPGITWKDSFILCLKLK